jgi:hypothetical protein
MQELLVILSVFMALIFLIRMIYRTHYATPDKCQGCAVHKLYEAKKAGTQAK